MKRLAKQMVPPVALTFAIALVLSESAHAQYGYYDYYDQGVAQQAHQYGYQNGFHDGFRRGRHEGRENVIRLPDGALSCNRLKGY